MKSAHAYTTYGSVRGGCLHRHQTIGAALGCILKDERSTRKAGGYTDRTILRCDGLSLVKADVDRLEEELTAKERLARV